MDYSSGFHMVRILSRCALGICYNHRLLLKYITIQHVMNEQLIFLYTSLPIIEAKSISYVYSLQGTKNRRIQSGWITCVIEAFLHGL